MTAITADSSTPIYPLVLLGGGHSHVLWLKYWQQLKYSHPAKKIRPLLISDSATSPYSGMLPGLLSGDYSYASCYIDLVRLSHKSNCDFLQRRCINIQKVDSAIEGEHKEKLYRLDFAALDNQPPASIFCRVLSINIGSQPFISKADSHNIAKNKSWKVKPINKFFQNYQTLQKSLAHLNTESLQKPLIKIMGAGAAGVEIACAIKKAQPNSQIQLHSHSTLPLPRFNFRTQNRCLKHLNKLGIEYIRTYIHPSTSRASTNDFHNGIDTSEYGFTIWCTQSAAAEWLVNTNLKLSAEGFIKVDKYLQTSFPGVFAAGDCLHFSPKPLPKAGVYAVRQAKTLFTNTCRYLTDSNAALTTYKPQKSILAIVNMGNYYALAQKGRWSAAGFLPWAYKHYIDSKFMSLFK